MILVYSIFHSKFKENKFCTNPYNYINKNQTRTKDKKKMSLESRQFLQDGPLKYEVRAVLGKT